MSTFEIYQDEVRVTSVVEGDGLWKTLDLAPFLADPTAKAVILRGAYASGVTPIKLGFRGINDSFSDTNFIRNNNKYITSCVSLAGGTTIQIRVSGQTTPTVWIVGEIHDDAVIYDAAIDYSTPESQFEQFIDRQPTPQGSDALDDIGQVIVRGTVTATLFANFGIREKGSRQGFTPTSADSGTFWYVIGLNADGFYQTYTDGKTGFDVPFVHFQEIGYILKTGNVVTVLNVPEENPARSWPAWGLLDFSATNEVVDEDAISVGIEWYDDSAAGQSFVRAVDSVIFGRRGIEEATPVVQAVALNAARQVNYQKRTLSLRLFIWWWEIPTPEPIVPVGRVDFESAIVPGICMSIAIIAGICVDVAIAENINMKVQIVAEICMSTVIIASVCMHSEIVNGINMGVKIINGICMSTMIIASVCMHSEIVKGIRMVAEIARSICMDAEIVKDIDVSLEIA